MQRSSKSKMEKLSKTLVHYLRHSKTAPIDAAGYVLVQHILSMFKIDIILLEEIINQPTDKRRLFFSVCFDFIRAASGHSIAVQVSLLGTEITDYKEVRYCCHGTTEEAYQTIKKEGLSRMKRSYIHFASRKKHIKKNSTVIISLNVPKYLQSGMVLVRLDDGNYAATGNTDGTIKPIFFRSVKQKKM